MKCRAPACGYVTRGEPLCPEHIEVWRQLFDQYTAELDEIIRKGGDRE